MVFMPSQTPEDEPLPVRTNVAVGGTVVLEQVLEIRPLHGLPLALRHDYLLAPLLTDL